VEVSVQALAVTPRGSPQALREKKKHQILQTKMFSSMVACVMLIERDPANCIPLVCV